MLLCLYTLFVSCIPILVERSSVSELAPHIFEFGSGIFLKNQVELFVEVVLIILCDIM